MSTRRELVLFATVLLVTGSSSMLVLCIPPRSARVSASAAIDRITIGGAFHVHTKRSDGAGTIEDVAAAAARAGLRFVIVTDHGDGMRSADPPSYRSGVLIVDGVEISTSGGHYAVVGMKPPPYPITGQPRDVVEDVARFGGFGVVAHGDSPKPELKWTDWDAPIDGVEWVNLDTEWRRSGTVDVAKALFGYVFRPSEAIGSLIRPTPIMLRQWDAAATHRRLVALAALDAHSGLPSYDACFRTLTTRVELDAPLSGDAAVDARALLAAFRAGHHYTAIDARAVPGRFDFTGSRGDYVVREGDSISEGEPLDVNVYADAPPRSRIVLLRDGEVVAESGESRLSYRAAGDRAVYRAEVRLRTGAATDPVPWIVSNPIYVGARDRTDGRSRAEAVAAADAIESGDVVASWHREGDPSSRASLESGEAAGARSLVFNYELGAGRPSNQFAALVGAIRPGVLTGYDRLTLTARASRPLRLAVALRPGGTDNPPRWVRSVYLDSMPRTVTIFFDEMRATTPDPARPVPLTAIRGLMFIAHTGNTLPGSGGEVVFSRIAFAR